MVHRNRCFTVLKHGGSFHGKLFNNQRVSLFELSSEQAVFQLSMVFFSMRRLLLGRHQGVVSSFLLHQLTVVTSLQQAELLWIFLA
jgi:hypothetical protein